MTIAGRMPEVQVVYDRGCQRVAKHFADAYEARRFYVAKFKAGKNPAVKKAESTT